MIRSTVNETIASVEKQRHAVLGLFTDTNPKGESIEVVSVSGVLAEVTDSGTNHVAVASTFPSNAFNGSFE